MTSRRETRRAAACRRWVFLVVVAVSAGCDENPRQIRCPPAGCLDSGPIIVPDSDIVQDADGFVWPDARPAGGSECSLTSHCVLAINYNFCCPCPRSTPTSSIRRSHCMFDAASSSERPEGCGLGCREPELCAPCPIALGVDCRAGRCTTLYDGDCQPDALSSCDSHEICKLVDGVATCVEDPSTCRTDEDCVVDGWRCRDWRTGGELFCWHPDSTCFDDLSCPDNNSCRDVDRDGSYRCVDISPQCRVGAPDDCPSGQECVNADDDGLGSCEAL